MKSYLLKRSISSFIVLISVITISFFITRIIPGDPTSLWVGNHPSAKQIEIAKKDLGLDKPLASQFFSYVKSLSRGDLGLSIRTKQPVSFELKRRFTATLELVSLSIIFSTIIGYPLGLFAGIYKRKKFDKIISFISYLGLSFPVFWSGMILQVIFFSYLDILPLQGRLSLELENYERITGLILLDSILHFNWELFIDAFRHLLLPCAALVFSIFGIIVRTSRTALINTMSEPYFETYTSYGFSKKDIVFKTAYKNTLIPTITIIGLSYGLLLGGTFLIESIFNWPGIGQFCVLSILTNDYPSIAGVTLLYAISYTFINFTIDILYVLIDKRIEL